MDYEGQKLCENLFYYLILIFGAIGWVYGYIQQDFVYVFYAWSVGMVISVIVSFVQYCSRVFGCVLIMNIHSSLSTCLIMRKKHNSFLVWFFIIFYYKIFSFVSQIGHFSIDIQ